VLANVGEPTLQSRRGAFEGGNELSLLSIFMRYLPSAQEH